MDQQTAMPLAQDLLPASLAMEPLQAFALRFVEMDLTSETMPAMMAIHQEETDAAALARLSQVGTAQEETLQQLTLATRSVETQRELELKAVMTEMPLEETAALQLAQSRLDLPAQEALLLLLTPAQLLVETLTELVGRLVMMETLLEVMAAQLTAQPLKLGTLAQEVESTQTTLALKSAETEGMLALKNVMMEITLLEMAALILVLWRLAIHAQEETLTILTLVLSTAEME